MKLNTLLFLLPVLCGLLLLLTWRKEGRRQFVANRLKAFKRVDTADPSVSLERSRPRTISISLFPIPLRAWIDRALETTGNRIRLLHLLITGFMAASLVMVFTSRVLAVNSVLVVLLTFVAAALTPGLVIRVAQSWYQRQFLDIFPEALDLIRRGIKAGLPVNEALVVASREIADPVGNELRRVLEQVQLGVPLIDALQAASNRVRLADFQFMVATLALQQKTGGSLAETLANLSTVIRARKALRLKARGLSAEAKASAMILAVLPFLVGGAMYVTNRDLVRVMFVDSRGRFMLGIALLSLLTGLTTMFVLVKKAVR